MIRAITAISAIVMLAVLGLLLSTSAVATGVIFGVLTGTVTALALANLRSQPPRQPTRYVTHQPTQITHQTLIVYQLDAQGQPQQVAEAKRTLTTTT